jgi:hypothetical protein
VRKKNVKITEKTTCYAEQLPFSVSYYVKGKKFKFSKFVYRGKDENETFMNNWLELMIKDAGRIYRDEYVYYAKLNLPKYILRKLGSTEQNSYNISIKVLGFNSKKFDVNIFINYITNPKIHIANIISTDFQFKYSVLHHDDYPYDLHF